MNKQKLIFNKTLDFGFVCVHTLTIPLCHPPWTTLTAQLVPHSAPMPDP